MRPTKADYLLTQMKPGRVYRRGELARLSKAVDRELRELLEKKHVRQAAAGLYYRPKQSRWGEVPADAHELLRSFLKTDDFLVTSPNVFNSLGVGLTQMVNTTVVYNRKRTGKFLLDGSVYEFKRPGNYPTKTTEEYLYVDLLNNVDDLLERPDNFEHLLRKRLHRFPRRTLEKNSLRYGKTKTQMMLQELITNVA